MIINSEHVWVICRRGAPQLGNADKYLQYMGCSGSNSNYFTTDIYHAMHFDEVPDLEKLTTSIREDKSLRIMKVILSAEVIEKHDDERKV